MYFMSLYKQNVHCAYYSSFYDRYVTTCVCIVDINDMVYICCLFCIYLCALTEFMHFYAYSFMHIQALYKFKLSWKIEIELNANCGLFDSYTQPALSITIDTLPASFSSYLTDLKSIQISHSLLNFIHGFWSR